jgi:O-antigen biosynthesis protein WbqV
MVRYFMTTREAADLVLTSASHAEESRALTERTNGDERASVYVLKMGQPVRIYELAERMIRLAGYEPGEDIEISVTGTRPGERLHEILFAREEPRTEIGIDGVMAAKPIFADRDRVDEWLQALNRAIANGDRALAEQVFEDAIPEFKRRKPAPQPAAPVPQARLASN